MHGRLANTYETGATRMFLHGRTETARPLTAEMVRLVRAFGGSADRGEKARLYREFVNKHVHVMAEACAGRGIDRHLLGLRAMLQPNETHPFLSDPVLGEMADFVLSTSNMSPGDNYVGIGFAPSALNGYGTNYKIGRSGLKISFSSRKSHPESSALRFRGVFARVADDLIDLIAEPSARL